MTEAHIPTESLVRGKGEDSATEDPDRSLVPAQSTRGLALKVDSYQVGTFKSVASKPHISPLHQPFRWVPTW